MSVPPKQFWDRVSIYALGIILVAVATRLVVVNAMGLSVWVAVAIVVAACTATAPSMVHWLRETLHGDE